MLVVAGPIRERQSVSDIHLCHLCYDGFLWWKQAPRDIVERDKADSVTRKRKAFDLPPFHLPIDTGKVEA